MTVGPERVPSVDRPALTVVMPAFNEERGIEAALAACVSALGVLLADDRLAAAEVVIVNDGSTDGTAAILDRLSGLHPELNVVHHHRNRGLGAALRSGFERASGDLIFYTDADLPVDLGAIGTALDLLDDQVAAVCAYRTNRRAEGIRRCTYSLSYNWLCRRLFGLRVRDVNFAAKLLRSQQIKALGLRSEGSFIDAELLVRLRQSGANIREFPAEYRPRSDGASTLSSARVVVRILRELVELRPEITEPHRLSDEPD